MGGNGFYWRCAYHPEKPWIMELRRAEIGARYWETPAGESYHSFTGEYGGTWRRIGKAPQTLVGVGTAATGFDASSYYRRRPESHDPRASFIFEGVDEEIIGAYYVVADRHPREAADDLADPDRDAVDEDDRRLP